MRSLTALLGAICLLPLAAFALECIQCFEKNSDSCHGPSVVCKEAKECMVLSEYYHLGENTFHAIKKGCNDLYPCGASLYAFTDVTASLKSHIQCCKEDNCNSFNHSMPPEDEELKGKYCTSCQKADLMECESEQTIRCKEEKDKCYSIVGKMKDPGGNQFNGSFKGCASSEFCDLEFEAMVGMTDLGNDVFTCT